jgi:hypothetical protein
MVNVGATEPFYRFGAIRCAPLVIGTAPRRD